MTFASPTASSALRAGFLDRARIVARPGFNRWLVPPAALAMHLCIGMVYGLSVFWLPLSRSLGTAPAASCADLTVFQALTTTSCNWRVSDVTLAYQLGLVILGLSAALWGGWLERAGPRKAGVVAAICWSGGFMIAAIGANQHQLWLILLGLGLIGGVGLGLGYISPVSMLIKWFPDRRGMATGMAIMGFGGGAMVGAPLATMLMSHFATPGDPTNPGVWQTFLVLGAIYAVFMMGGALGYRVPAPDWRPTGWAPDPAKKTATRFVALENAHKTGQFWLVWTVLCLNVSAGIGVLAVASPMLQEIFAGRLIGLPEVSFTQLNTAQAAQVAVIAAGFTGLLSLFNIGGRFFWASTSDRIGRKATYFIFFALGIALYASAPTLAQSGSQALFVLAVCVIISMYGGGFATVPAYLADLFGTQFVGAIHGRLLTAWSTAAIIGPLLITSFRESQIAAGVPRADVYNSTLYILSGLLLVGLLANLAIRPVAEKWFEKEPAKPAAPSMPAATAHPAAKGEASAAEGMSPVLIAAWLAVGVPIAWGAWVTFTKALALFG